MTKISARPPDCACEGCWDARSVPGLERDYLLCDYPHSPDYGHVVYYRHACECFAVDRTEEFLTLMAAVRTCVTPDGMGAARQVSAGMPSESDSRGWCRRMAGKMRQILRLGGRNEGY